MANKGNFKQGKCQTREMSKKGNFKQGKTTNKGNWCSPCQLLYAIKRCCCPTGFQDKPLKSSQIEDKIQVDEVDCATVQ